MSNADVGPNGRQHKHKHIEEHVNTSPFCEIYANVSIHPSFYENYINDVLNVLDIKTYTNCFDVRLQPCPQRAPVHPRQYLKYMALLAVHPPLVLNPACQSVSVQASNLLCWQGEARSFMVWSWCKPVCTFGNANIVWCSSLA